VRYSTQIKPISYLKANAAEVLQELADQRQPRNSVHWATRNIGRSSKPYRLIYRVVGQQVVIYLIADGRRDMQPLLARRLLGG
jgi:hypothetical protein